jgi:hypothetical protein
VDIRDIQRVVNGIFFEAIFLLFPRHGVCLAERLWYHEGQ